MYLAHLEKLSRTRIEDVLVEEGILERPKVEEAQAEQEKSGRQLGDILCEREIVTDYDFAKLVVAHYALPFLDVSNYSTRRDVLQMLGSDFCVKNAILPLDQFGSVMTLAVCEMPSPELIDEIATKTGLTPFLFVAVRRNLLELLEAERKRGPRRTVVGAPVKEKTGAVTLVEPEVPTDQTEEMPLPELELPLVSMKLLHPAAKSVAAPARSRSPGSTPVVVAPNPKAALSWMDSATRAAPAPSKGPPKAPTDAGSQKVDKFAFRPGVRETTGGSRLSSTSAVPRSALHPPTATPSGPSSSAPAAADEAAPEDGKPKKAWQSIFEMGEDAVKKEKTS